MTTRARIAHMSDVQSVRASGPKRARRPAQAAVVRLSLLLLLGALVYASMHLLGPGFVQDQARKAIGFLAWAGEWVRAALAAGFQNIPVL